MPPTRPKQKKMPQTGNFVWKGRTEQLKTGARKTGNMVAIGSGRIVEISMGHSLRISGSHIDTDTFLSKMRKSEESGILRGANGASFCLQRMSLGKTAYSLSWNRLRQAGRCKSLKTVLSYERTFAGSNIQIGRITHSQHG